MLALEIGELLLQLSRGMLAEREGDPEEGLFTGTDTMNRQESFLAVELHELCHWSGAERRLNRKLRNRFGISEYAAEELVALSGQSGCELSGQSG